MLDEHTLSGSLEDYIETIYHLVDEKRVARARDIATRLGVKSSSVTGALRTLSNLHLINYAPYEVITLTPRGERVALEIVQRHRALHDFFRTVLMVDEIVADEAACRIEHAIPQVVFQRLVEFSKFIETCPRSGADWLEAFAAQCSSSDADKSCEKCIASCATRHKRGLKIIEKEVS